jgi:cytochrome c oxidase subunit 2
MGLILEQASSFAKDIDFLIILIAILGGFWLFVAEFFLFYFMFKFRKKSGVKGQYISGEKKEEMKWIHLPHNLVLLCDIVIIFFAVRVWYDIKQVQPPADETIRVVGRQWAWTFVHPGLDHKLGTEDDVEVVDELHVMVDKTYHFQLESKDVLHSFSVPVFRLKQDAIPGRVITGWFKPIKSGTFDVQCAEICGIGHGIMKSRIKIESEEEHRAWLASQPPRQVGH